MSYTVNLGCWGSIFAVPTDVVDKYLKIAGSAQLKVLLFILRHSGEQFDLETISQYLNMDPFDVKDCIEFWSSFGIIAVNNNVITPAEGVPILSQKNIQNRPNDTTSESVNQTEKKNVGIFSPAQNHTPADNVRIDAMPPILDAKNDPIKPKQSEPLPVKKAEQEKSSDTVMARPLRPDPVYVAKRIREEKEIESLLNEAQYILGRPVSPNENAGMIMMHDNDGLPCEVILMLLTYGTSNQKGMRQIEAMGAAWAKEGILTLEQADEKIRELEQSKEAYRKIQSILGLEYRKPSAKEEENYTRWLNEWKFSDEMIKEAYDICVNAKGKYIPNYVNTILMRWNQNGIRTVEQVRAERSKAYQKNASGSNNSNDNGRKSSFDINDLSGLSMFND